MHRSVVFLLSLSLSPFFPSSPLASSLAAASGCTNNDIHNAASYKQRISNRSALSCAYAPLLSSSFVDSRLWLNALIERGIVDRKSGVEKLRHADHPIETKHSDEKSCSELRGLRRRRIILNLREENIEVSLHLNS